MYVYIVVNIVKHVVDKIVCYIESENGKIFQYDVYRWCVCSEKLLMMDRGTVRNM